MTMAELAATRSFQRKGAEMIDYGAIMIFGSAKECGLVQHRSRFYPIDIGHKSLKGTLERIRFAACRVPGGSRLLAGCRLLAESVERDARRRGFGTLSCSFQRLILCTHDQEPQDNGGFAQHQRDVCDSAHEVRVAR